MNLVSSQYTVSHRSFELFISGCLGNCKGCHGELLKDFSLGTTLTDELIGELLEKIEDMSPWIDSIWVMGGDPCDQEQSELTHLLKRLNESGKQIVLFTRHQPHNISRRVIELCDMVKCGEYDERKRVDDYYSHGIKLATANQKVYKQEELL